MEREVGVCCRNWVRGSGIGKGSFGALSLAMDTSNGQVFAVKSVDLNSSPVASIEALENEIQILRSLSSPYIVSYFGDDTTQESPIATCRNLHLEYMPGGTVADLAATNGAVGEPEVRSYTRCVARALHHLHSFAGVVHCDVKGRNVLIGPSWGAAKLADFGSAMRISDGVEQWTWGTPLWMAPEVVRGERPTPASDVWSLGCTVIEMVTGAQPWHDSGPDALLRIGFSAEVPKFPDHLSKIGRDFLDKCLRRDATERWTSEQLLQHPFLSDDDMSATGPSPRSVLDLATSEFCDDDDSSKENDPRPSSGHGTDSGEVMDRGRERVRELALDRTTVMSWESNGWEMVRSAGEPTSVGHREGGGLCREYLDCFGGEPPEWSGSDGEASWGWLSDGTRCSASPCRCCGVSLAFVLGWCDSLLLHTVLVNAIPFFFSLVFHTFFLALMRTSLVSQKSFALLMIDSMKITG
ncbi:mitogen-activated protein kinase kinase kinase 18-like [Phoenix dactylifera]|uniref:Mitogen-activated protein kinase kinase kinase 18-like n=1 Tax=Phoenix dactylifera TaxID=42345 RepID=A0A8B7C0H4_PHODC|nr:mitogen-activated protein kinase kinase kinase 18-like [Phoenix dactylifera]